MRGYLSAQLYLIAVGSNVRHAKIGPPPRVVAAAMRWLDGPFGKVLATSRVIASEPLGPSLRRYANAALLLESRCDPPLLLRRLKGAEHLFGRRARGQRWAARVLDLDIVLWSGGRFASPALNIPHAAFRSRAFVLAPAAAIAPHWRDPLTGLSLAQLHARLTGHRPLPRQSAPRAVVAVHCRRPRHVTRALSSVGRATDF